MLNSVPKQIVLTLQSSPPFLLEIVLAITIALLLAIPLVTRLQYFLGYTEEPLISFNFLNPRRRQISSSTSGSNESLTLFPVRHVNSSPNFKNSYLTESDIINGSPFTMDISSSYNHNTEYPFSVAYDYGYYRHKLIESNLKRHYGSQPPGNVVLNSLHLSSIDSATGLRLSEKYNHSIFELAPNSDHNQERDQLITLIHPRDHFLRKGSRRYESADKSTETLFISNVSHNFKEEEEIELKEKITSLPRRKTRIKKDKSSSDNVKIFKVKIDSFDNSRPVSPFKNREIYEIPEVKSEITEKGTEIYDPNLESKILDKKEEICKNEIIKSRPGSPVKKIKERKSKIKMNLKVKEKLSEVRDIKYDSLIIDDKNKEGENLKPEEEIEVNKKISSATVELNSPKNNFIEENIVDKNILSKDKLCGESENLDCKFKEEIKAEAEKCLAKMSDVVSKSYGSSRGEALKVEKQSRPNTSSGVLSRAFKHLSPKVNSRPRSSGGGFAWEVPDISGKVWSDDNEEKINRSKDESKKPGTPTGLKRPRSANPQFFRKKSDPVLPVLESIIDLTYDVPVDLLDEECLVGGKEDQNRPLELKHPGFGENQSDSGSGSRDKKGKSKIKGGKKGKSEKICQGPQDSLLQKKPFLRSRSGRYSVLKVTKFKSKK
ncbi:uncharacterized protein LOC123259168 isoform X1 [Cotesia glomerata]|uniref:Uncharacterized protein n=2 Tax=Cotesia glomerata TaxID=32391 RepID=A0AAV7HXZ0_COTGL|nr:uncharacterized protein LOC123259168 isoform X1 [Cotesia glomerata]KAH0539303.1 hypothetical protein KQX54_003791 [Cotesia glomerata]